LATPHLVLSSPLKIIFNSFLPTFVFKYLSLNRAFLNVLHSSLYINFKGLLFLVDLHNPLLCSAILLSKLSVDPK